MLRDAADTRHRTQSRVARTPSRSDASTRPEAGQRGRASGAGRHASALVVPKQVERHPWRCYIAQVARGCGSVGRASPCQGEGRGFESRHPLWCEVGGVRPGQASAPSGSYPGGPFCRLAAGTAVWPSGSGKGLQNPVPRFNSGHRLDPTRGAVAARAIASRSLWSLDSVCPRSRARSSAGERCLHTAEVTGSIPVAPTILSPRSAGICSVSSPL
jgi:hypothetical protein